jgi:hypothetical protein
MKVGEEKAVMGMWRGHWALIYLAVMIKSVIRPLREILNGLAAQWDNNHGAVRNLLRDITQRVS